MIDILSTMELMVLFHMRRSYCKMVMKLCTYRLVGYI